MYACVLINHSFTHTHTHTSAIPKMTSLANSLIHNPTSRDMHDQFVLSLREFLQSIREIQSVLHTGEPQAEKVPHPPSLEAEPQGTSTPLASVQEQMMKRRNAEHPRAQPRYIGSLGAARSPPRRRVLPTTPSSMEGATKVGVSRPHPVPPSIYQPIDLPLSNHHIDGEEKF